MALTESIHVPRHPTKKSAPPVREGDIRLAPIDGALEFRPIVANAPSAAAHYMSWRVCPVCGGERHRTLFQYDDFQFYTDAPHSKQATIRQVQCARCFSVFMNPVFTPEGFAALFAEAGASYGSTSSRQEEQIAWLTTHRLLAPGGTLLDIGCYDGTFIGKLPEGVKGIGVDIDEPAVARASRRLGVSSRHRFICADFENFEIGGSSDVITMFHVLEHLPRPVAVLERLARLSTAKTRLVVEVPVLENVLNTMVGDVSGMVTVQHLTHFTIASLDNVLRRAGWKPLLTKAMDDYNGLRVVAELASPGECRPRPDDHHLVMRYMKEWYATVAEVEARLRKLSTPHCILRGGGLQTEYLYHLTTMFAGERDFLIIDNDPLKQGRSWRGVPIVGTEHLARADWRDTQMVLSSYSHQMTLRDEARAASIPDAAVVPLYDRVRRY